jgi:hypothetical protein
VSPVGYELGLCIPQDGVHQSHCRENLKYYINSYVCCTMRRIQIR